MWPDEFSRVDRLLLPRHESVQPSSLRGNCLHTGSGIREQTSELVSFRKTAWHSEQVIGGEHYRDGLGRILAIHFAFVINS